MFRLKALLWFIAFFFLKKYYKLKVAQTKEEKEKVFQFRYQIYRVELQHTFLDTTLAHGDMLYDEYDFVDHTIILYSGDINNITGTLRLTVWNKNTLPKSIKRKYTISEKVLSQFEKIGKFSFFIIRKEYRKGFLGAVFLCFWLSIIQKTKIPIPNILYSECQPGLIKYYLSMGCFDYTDDVIFEEFRTLQIPLAVIPCDLDYLRKIKCVAYYVVKYYVNNYEKNNPNTVVDNKNTNFESIIPHLKLTMTPREAIQYGQSIISNKSRKNYDLVISILKNIILLPLKKGVWLIKKDMVDYDAYYIVEGTLGVYLDGILIAKLNPGDFCGEMALLNEIHTRYSDVQCMTDAKLILIPRATLHELIKHKPKVAVKFYDLLCYSLIDKLVDSNKFLHNLQKQNNFK